MQKMNLDYLEEQTKELSRARRDSIHCYLVGAASVLLDEEKWKEIVDNAIQFFDRTYKEKVDSFEMPHASDCASWCNEPCNCTTAKDIK